VTGEEGADRRWSIGELARATGLTVRTLHHYDEIGLVSAGERTDAGHRRYTATDLHRLYRVRALRRFGLSLEEIASVLRDSTEDLTTLHDLLATQLAELDIHANRISQLRQQIADLLGKLDRSIVPDPEQFLTTLEMISLFETYFAEELRDYLEQRRAEPGVSATEAMLADWLVLAEEARQCVRAGIPVDDPRAQDLCRRWTTILEAFQGGSEALDEQVRTAAHSMWVDNEARLSAYLTSRLGWSGPVGVADVVGYVRRVRDAGTGR
jgi:DNA-binding transcriptional MerR regulator